MQTIKGSYKHAQHHEDHPRASKRKETSTSVSDSPTDFSRDIENNEGMGENSNEVKRLKFVSCTKYITGYYLKIIFMIVLLRHFLQAQASSLLNTVKILALLKRRSLTKKGFFLHYP